MWTKEQIIDAGEVAELYYKDIRHLISTLEREYPTTKPILEWLEELPEPYRTQAIENYNRSDIRGEYEKFTLVDAIYDAFIWCKSPEGHEYWSELCERLKKSPPERAES